MADMKIAIRLGRKSSVYPSLIFAVPEIFRNDIANKMRRRSISRTIVAPMPPSFVFVSNGPFSSVNGWIVP